MPRTVGVLLDLKTYKGIPRGRTGNERLALYDKAGRMLGLKPFYMCLHYVNGKWALGYSYKRKKYKLIRRAIPKVTHNRAITLTPYLKRKLKLLSRSSNVFNRQNRYDKHLIHKLVLGHASLSKYLPESVKYSRRRLENAMTKHASLFIKPTNSSVGNGIIKISRHASGAWKMYGIFRKPKLVSCKQAVAYIGNAVRKKTYMIQEAIPLATYRGRPYDLRVSVQRGEHGQWQITGIVGKVAASGRHVTNVAKGGSVKRSEELFKASGLNPEQVKHELHQATLAIAKHLSNHLPHLADLGLDVGVDQNGNVKLIEVNGRDQRYSFKKANMRRTFYQTYETPLRYAKYLMK
ncbi:MULTISPECIES: YheC/YheD family protein [unclassified Paenibacillus]|uniref:YheC/YheD family protein n=1 Tax=unclassified Paenibacillus TaxID=185978 RepID=UPI00237942ED|nr:YheC/YheD family protein [Paenibacillus sp. MAHUQ-63]